MATDIPDWTESVTIESGTVTVSGAVDATITSGTVDANITNASVPISGSVAISSGTVDISAGTVTVENKAGTVIQTGDRFDQLFHGNETTTGTAHSASVTIPGATVKRTYAAVLVVAVTASTAARCLAVVSNRTTSNSYLRAGAPMAQSPGASSVGVSQGVVPVPVTAGKGLAVTVLMAAAGTVTITVFGLTRDPGVPLRPDGRAYPLGSLTFHATKTAAGAVDAIAAPASPLRILLSSLDVIGAPTANARVTATVGGSARTISKVFGAQLRDTPRIGPQGLLLDSGTALVLTLTAAKPVHAYGTYDLVV